jgi:hypothetical protein
MSQDFTACYWKLEVLKEILVGKIKDIIAKFLPASLLGVSAETRAENSGGWMENDLNSDGVRKRSVNGRSCMGRFVRYHPYQ